MFWNTTRQDEYLYLIGCTGLTAIPEGLAAKTLDLRGCTGLTAIPDSIRKKAFY